MKQLKAINKVHKEPSCALRKKHTRSVHRSKFPKHIKPPPIRGD